MNTQYISIAAGIASVIFVLLSMAIIGNTYFRIRAIRKKMISAAAKIKNSSYRDEELNTLILKTLELLPGDQLDKKSIRIYNTGYRSDLHSEALSSGVVFSKMKIQSSASTQRAVKRTLVHG